MSVKLTPTLRINDAQEPVSGAHAWPTDPLSTKIDNRQVMEPPLAQEVTPAAAEVAEGAAPSVKRASGPGRRRGRGQMEIGDGTGQAEEGTARDSAPTGAPRYTRRLSDKILIAFHHACDQADFEVAEQLLHILEMMLTRRPLTPDGTRRRNMESLVAAHERLWHLRHPHTGDTFV